jgi:hypothetical protein
MCSMANDHYVPQTYLELFADPAIDGKLNAYSKKTGKTFQPFPKSVCSERDGDSNPAYLKRSNLLGEFRAIYEPHLRSSIDAIESRRASATDKHVVAMFMASLIACTPAWRRAGAEISNILQKERLLLERDMRIKHDAVADFPVEGVDMLERGELEIDTDTDYVKAVGTKSLMPTALSLYQEDWIVGINTTADPFLTSDYPFAIDRVRVEPSEIMYRHLPLSPRTSVTVAHSGRFPLDMRPEATQRILSTPQDGGLRYANLRSDFVDRLNRLVAQCAEDHVFSSRASDATAQLVKRHARHRLDVEYVQFPDGEDGVIQGTILRVRES